MIFNNRCYVVGLEVEQGRGEYENTTFVTFTARYQIVNHTSHPICIAQHCLVSKSLPPFDDSSDSQADGIVQIAPDSSMAFHWWRADAESLVSVRMLTNGCYWSGRFDIDRPASFHINMRDGSGNCYLVHAEIISLGPMNCVLLSDASITPPPYRIDNFSAIPLMFCQKGVVEDRLRTVVNPNSSMAYALDEPIMPAKIELSIAGGLAARGNFYDLDMLGEGEPLEYENFIFIELDGTNLVLDVDTDGKRVIFAPINVARRCQLWRMTSTGILQNEGVLMTGNKNCVLDIETSGIDPSKSTQLCLRQKDDHRMRSQTWHFTETGRLTCAPTSRVNIHGGAEADGTKRNALLGPVDQKVNRKRLRPGSGILCVTIVTDGPTRVVRVCDLKTAKSPSKYNLKPSTLNDSLQEPRNQNPFRFQLFLPQGIGISLVSSTEELAYITLRCVTSTYKRNSSLTESLRLSVAAIQIDNQLLSTPCLVILFSDTRVKKKSRRKSGSSSDMKAIIPSSASASNVQQSSMGPALTISVSRFLNSPSKNVVVFKTVSISICQLHVQLEERFIWKVLQLFGVFGSDHTHRPSETQISGRKQSLTKQQGAQDSRFAPLSHRFSHIVLGRRFYFASLAIRLNRLDLGMTTTATSNLSQDLRRIKRSFRVPLVQFSGAPVELDTFQRHHVLATGPLLVAAVKQHYSKGFKSQAGKIFGSIDFLGSPLGLFTDVTEGLSGLIRDANVSGLVQHVTFGISNAAARVAGHLGETLGSVVSDPNYRAERELIRYMGPGAKPSDHLVAGLVGFGHGVIGGVTSIFTQSYHGVNEQGPIGLVTGFSKGLVGAVTRPAAGVLDLAAGTAKAVSETARSSSAPRILGRVREPRCVSSLTGALMEYSGELAEAQMELFTMNVGRLNERLLSMETLFHPQLPGHYDDSESGPRLHRVDVLVTSECVYVRRGGHSNPNTTLRVRYDSIKSCRSVCINSIYHVELLFGRPTNNSQHDDDNMTLSAEQQRSGYLIRATSEDSAQRIATMINCARLLYDRSRYFVSAATLLRSSDASSLLYGYSGFDFGITEPDID